MTTAADSPRRAFRRILFNTGWLTAARLSGDMMGVLLFIAISRKLGLEAVGEYSFAFAVAALAAAVVGLGLEEYGLREYSRLDQIERRRMLREVMGLQLNFLLLTVAAVLAFLLLTRTPLDTVVVVAVVTVHVLTFQFAVMYFIPAYAQQKMLLPALAEFLCRAGGMCACILMIAMMGSDLAGGLMPLALGTTVLLLIALFSALHYNGELALSLSPRNVVSLLKRTWPFAVSTIIYNVYLRMAVILLVTLKGQGENGIYATALKLYEFGLLPIYLLGIAAFPALSRHYVDDGAQFCGTADKFLRTALGLGALLAWGLIFVAPPLLGVLLGEEFAVARTATQLVSIVAILGALDGVCSKVILAMNLQSKRVKVQGVAVAANVVFNCLLIPPFGVYGAIAATVAAQVIMVGWYFAYIARAPGMMALLRTLRSFGLVLTVALVAGLAGLGLDVHPWMIGAISLAALAAMVLGTGFVPAPWRLFQKL